MRAASRQLGGGLLRLLHSLSRRPPPGDALGAPRRPAPHHPLVLGAGIAWRAARRNWPRGPRPCRPAQPASAAVRLLGLDPFAVQAMLARLAPGIDECATRRPGPRGRRRRFPADGAPALDLLADFHLTAEVRLFAS